MVPHELTIQAARRHMRDGELTARELMESCLERIHALEGSVRAWVEVYEKEALEAARRCDDAFHAERWQGDLHGIPIGVKDIIHVKRMWTYSGFPAMSIPCGVDQNGLPFAVQLAAQPMAEDRLLAVSAWCESVLGFDASPLARDI